MKTDLIGPGALAEALKMPRSTFLRRVAAGKIPEGLRTKGGHRRWKPRVAARIVAKAGKPVPAGWET